MFGGGVVVLQDGKLVGGDGGYYYLGTYQVEGAAFKATIEVSPFIKDYESVFKTFGRPFKLDLEGSLTDDNHAVARGRPVEMPNFTLGAKLTKRA